MNSNKYIVSVIVIAYNVDKFLEKCISSIINQQYKDLEIIVVNDGSTDLTKKIAEKQSELDPRIKVINQTNLGASAARNTGIKNSTGDFICFVDGDDYLANDCISYFINIYDKTKADICISMNNFTTKNHTQIKNDSITTISAEYAVAELLYPRVRMGVWNKLWKRDFIIKNNFKFVEGQVTGEGLIFMTNAAQYANCVGVGRRRVNYYRLDNENSATTVANFQKYGLGSIKALDIVESNIDLSSSVICNAMFYQRWATTAYALRQIIDSNSRNEYENYYNDLIKAVRKNSLKMLNKDIKLPIRMKIIAVFRWINPVLLTKLSLYLRNRHIRKSNKISKING